MTKQSDQSNDRPQQGSVFSRLSNWLSKRHTPPRCYSIQLSERGFEVSDQNESLWSMEWEHIVRVVAFKLDRVTTDTICVGFQRVNESDRVWAVEEEWDGYRPLHSKLDQFTQGAWSEKWREVAHPAFEFNWTVIWERPDAPDLIDDPILIWRSPPAEPDPNA